MNKKIVYIGLMLQVGSSLATGVLSSHLQTLQGAYHSHVTTRPGVRFSSTDKTLNIVQSQKVIVDITVKDISLVKPLIDRLNLLGAGQVSSFKKQVSVILPIDKLKVLSEYSEISWVTSISPKMHGMKTRRSRGISFNAADQAMFTDVVRKKYNVDGTGVSIGVMSDSYNCIDEDDNGAVLDIALGELPADVTVVKEFPFCKDEDGELNASDEGRAMMQLIHDVAPGAKLFFYTAAMGSTAFAAGILALEAAGVNIIVDDIGYFDSPMFQDGPIAQAVNEVKKRGVTYFSAAGNMARYSYEQAFTEGEVIISRDKAHDFGKASGGVSDFYQQITLPIKQEVVISLQWDDPAEIAGGTGAKTDLDFFLLNAEDNTIITSSEESNIGHNPVELIGGALEIVGGGGVVGDIVKANLYISHRAGPIPKRIKYIIYGPSAPWPEDVPEGKEAVSVSVDEYDTKSSTIFGQANSAGAIAVGAIPYQETPWFNTELDKSRIEAFSSVGGTAIIFDDKGMRLNEPDVRLKPEIVAPDMSDTSFFGENTDHTEFPNFGGTSAAAPNAAALAALLKQAYPALSPNAISSALMQGSLNLNDPSAIEGETSPEKNACRVSGNFDFGTGCGLVQADLVFEQGNVFLSLATSTKGIPIDVPFEYLLKLKNFSGKDLHNVRIRALELPGHVAFKDIIGCVSIDDIEASCRFGTVKSGEIKEVVIKAIAGVSPNEKYPFKVDLLTGTEIDLSNTKADLDASVSTLTGDFNNDACVDTGDWSVLFGVIRSGGTSKEYDLNADDKVNSGDLLLMEVHYSNSGGASCL